MTSEKHLDYIQASFLVSEDDMRDRKLKAVAPVAFYKRGYIDPDGTRYYFGNPKSKKALMIASGNALQNIRNNDYSDENIVASLLKKEAKITRLDLAITQYDDPEMVTLEDMQEYFKQGKIKSPLANRGATLISSLELDGELYPETFYIGSLEKRGKKGLFRAYDKGVQFDISRYLMVRLELEERGENAHASANRIAEGNSVGSVFKSRFDIEDEKFQKMVNAQSASVLRGKAKDKEGKQAMIDKKWKWLMEAVAPAIRELIEYEGNEAGTSANMANFIMASGLRPELLKAVDWLAEQKKIRDNKVNE